MGWLNNVLTVDPGWHTGYAYWMGDAKPYTGMFVVSKKKVISTTEHRMVDLWAKFSDLLDELESDGEVSMCVLESVMLWEGSLVSMTAARRGDIFKLASLLGGYAAICDLRNIPFKLVNANQWKGQLTKGAVAKRIERRIGMTFTHDHIADAVGIGLSEMGIL